MISEKEIGKNIKEIRSGIGITLEVLARETGFTKGYLSKVENSEKAPPVSTLIKLAKVFDVSISRILGEAENKSPISLVKKSQRQHLARDGTIYGYSYQTLAHPFTCKRMQPYVLLIPPTNKKTVYSQHDGEEMLFVLEGTMQFLYGDQEFIAEEGDCLYFDSGVPHLGVCRGETAVKCLIAIINPN